MASGTSVSLVTGGTGFIGRYLVDALVACGDVVRVIGRRPVISWRMAPRIDHMRADIAEPGVVEAALKGADRVFHLAAATQGSLDDHRNITVRGSERLLEAATGKPGRRVIFVSSLSVYDGKRMRDGALVDEEFPIEREPQLRGPYARAKTEADLAAQKYLEHPAVRLTIVRPGIVYGPRMKNPLNGVALSLRNRILVTTGTRDKRLPLVYVDDLVNILVRIAEKDAAIGRIYNVIHPDMPTVGQYLALYRELGTDRRTVIDIPLRKLLPVFLVLDRLSASIGRQSTLSYTVARLLGRVSYSANRIAQELGLELEVGWHEGLKRLCRQAV